MDIVYCLSLAILMCADVLIAGIETITLGCHWRVCSPVREGDDLVRCECGSLQGHNNRGCKFLVPGQSDENQTVAKGAD